MYSSQDALGKDGDDEDGRDDGSLYDSLDKDGDDDTQRDMLICTSDSGKETYMYSVGQLFIIHVH